MFWKTRQNGQNQHLAVIKFSIKKCLASVEFYKRLLNLLEDVVPSKTMVCMWSLNVVTWTLKMVLIMDAVNIATLPEHGVWRPTVENGWHW